MKKSILRTTVGVLALFSVMFNYGFAQDNTAPVAAPNPANTPTTTVAPTSTTDTINTTNTQTATPANNVNTTTVVAPSQSKVRDIYVSDQPNQDGYVLQGKNKVPPDSKKIYATVLLDSAVAGDKVIATLTYLVNKAQIGPVVATVGTTGNTMEAFAFTNTSMPWPKGDYQVDVSLSNGNTKTVLFSVGD